MAKTVGATTTKALRRRARIVEIMEERFAKEDKLPSRRELVEILNKEKRWGNVTYKTIYDDMVGIGKDSAYLRELSEAHLSNIARDMVESLQRIAHKAEEDGDAGTVIKAHEALNQMLNGRIGDASIVLLNSKLKHTENQLAEVQQELDDLKSKKVK